MYWFAVEKKTTWMRIPLIPLMKVIIATCVYNYMYIYMYPMFKWAFAAHDEPLTKWVCLRIGCAYTPKMAI
jgi:K+-sensing histidine kinase KdpD